MLNYEVNGYVVFSINVLVRPGLSFIYKYEPLVKTRRKLMCGKYTANLKNVYRVVYRFTCLSRVTWLVKLIICLYFGALFALKVWAFRCVYVCMCLCVK